MLEGLKPFLLDLNKLESDTGVEITINDESMILRATLASVCGDGLAAHQLFGLLNPAARHFCRMCMISRNKLKSGQYPDPVLRTKELYEEHLALVGEDASQMTETGVRENRALHASKYFHFTMNDVFDIMHDILEGIAQMELELVISHFVFSREYQFNVDMLNNRIHLFNYGLPEIKNKPSSNFSLTSLRNTKDHSIQQKAVQTWCLLRIFPFLISDVVPQRR